MAGPLSCGIGKNEKKNQIRDPGHGIAIFFPL